MRVQVSVPREVFRLDRFISVAVKVGFVRDGPVLRTLHVRFQHFSQPEIIPKISEVLTDRISRLRDRDAEKRSPIHTDTLRLRFSRRLVHIWIIQKSDTNRQSGLPQKAVYKPQSEIFVGAHSFGSFSTKFRMPKRGRRGFILHGPVVPFFRLFRFCSILILCGFFKRRTIYSREPLPKAGPSQGPFNARDRVTRLRNRLSISADDSTVSD